MRSPRWPTARALRHDGDLWRRAAAFGSRRGPWWLLRYSPPLIGLAWWAALPALRHAVRDNLVRVRGERGRLHDAVDSARTFTTFAGCLAETLSHGSANEGEIQVSLEQPFHLYRAVREKQGVILATAHTGGWEAAGQLLARELGIEVVAVMRRERDNAARSRQDSARTSAGYTIMHVGDDPLEALPLLRHLEGGGAVAMQIDRVPAGMRSLAVRLFGGQGTIPEGPLRLAQVSGAPIVPVFCARLGFRHYLVHADPPLCVGRRVDAAGLAAQAQVLADAMARFVERYPTQWLNFERLTAAGHGA